MHVVAEGVETPEHVAALRNLGCKLAQGFHFHRPLAPETMREVVAAAA
jgi:EAL domain-containing protein (putative c-di-GMP-specific phosphodiesterase class I)